MEIRGKNILVVGFGRSGLAAARHCLKRGARLLVTDLKDEGEFKTAIGELEQFRNSIKFCFGEHKTRDFQEADLVVVSPGVPFDLEGIREARKKGIPVVSEMELALQEIASPVIAISGTNGKSTATTLIGKFLEESGKKVCVGGNLGTPIIDLLQEASGSEYVVLEVSSYQLEITPSLRPFVAVMLNVTPDHLDRYKGFDDYVSAKRLLAEDAMNEGFFVYNSEDEIVSNMCRSSKARPLAFSVRGGLKEGAWVDGDKILLKLPEESLLSVSLKDVRLKGMHNRENIVASALAAVVAGAAPKAIEGVLRSFDGLPHRLQFVRTVNGVDFYDDSKGTNVGAVVKSLEGFSRPVVLIAGGLDKGGSYEPLRSLVKEKVKALILIGEAREKIMRELGDLTKTVIASSMSEAVRLAFEKAGPGDVVLLSPACASFDMFKDFNERGEVFAREVKKLKPSIG